MSRFSPRGFQNHDGGYDCAETIRARPLEPVGEVLPSTAGAAAVLGLATEGARRLPPAARVGLGAGAVTAAVSAAVASDAWVTTGSARVCRAITEVSPLNATTLAVAAVTLSVESRSRAASRRAGRGVGTPRLCPPRLSKS